MEDKDWEDLKENLQQPEYVEKFITAAITLIIDGDENDQS